MLCTVVIWTVPTYIHTYIHIYIHTHSLSYLYSYISHLPPPFTIGIYSCTSWGVTAFDKEAGAINEWIKKYKSDPSFRTARSWTLLGAMCDDPKYADLINKNLPWSVYIIVLYKYCIYMCSYVCICMYMILHFATL